jgi:pimeloyl-ACP methyl ester carboxylesterase
MLTGPPSCAVFDRRRGVIIQRLAYANSGHAPFMEEPDRFNRDLAAFIDTAVAH